MTTANLWPVYEFRPRDDAFPHRWADEPILRYAEGKWVPDDGEYDLAFVYGSFCLMVELPYQRNILWSWTTGHWREGNPEHPGANPWHYMLRHGTAEWGGNWGRDRHPNRIAGDRGMSFVCAKRHCANGLHVEFHLDDKHIAAGLLRRQDTKEVVTFPAAPVCMYCGDDSGAAAAMARAYPKLAESVS